MSDACKCVPCRQCLGTGIVWYSFGGRYLGATRCDDLDEFESCEVCGGHGVTDEDLCGLCIEQLDRELCEATEGPHHDAIGEAINAINQQHIPDGWTIRRSGPHIIVQHRDGSGWTAGHDAENNIASAILYRLADDMLKAREET